MKRYHCPLLDAVIVSIFLCRTSCSCCVRNSPSGIPRTLASSLSSIRLWISGRKMSALVAAFRQLIACSTLFRKGLCGGSIFRSVFGAGTVGFRWAGAPSYTKITDSSGSRFVLACVTRTRELAAFRQESGGKHKSIDRRYYHCHSQVSSSLAANLAIGSLSLPRSTITYASPDVVATTTTTTTNLYLQ